MFFSLSTLICGRSFPIFNSFFFLLNDDNAELITVLDLATVRFQGAADGPVLLRPFFFFFCYLLLGLASVWSVTHPNIKKALWCYSWNRNFSTNGQPRVRCSSFLQTVKTWGEKGGDEVQQLPNSLISFLLSEPNEYRKKRLALKIRCSGQMFKVRLLLR